jgi:hypothetical protein
MSLRPRIWRWAPAVVYAGWALICSFVLGGGVTVLVFFAVWAAIWLGFGRFARWGERRRTLLLRERGYYS